MDICPVSLNFPETKVSFINCSSMFCRLTDGFRVSAPINREKKIYKGLFQTFAHACADKSVNLPVLVGNMLIKLCFKGMTEAEIQSVSLSVNVFDFICMEALFYLYIDEWLIFFFLTIHVAEGFYYKSLSVLSHELIE